METNYKLSIEQVIFLYLCKTPIYRTKLNKLFFFIDALYYSRNKSKQSTLTGFSYYKLPYGPVPSVVRQLKNYMVHNSFVNEEIRNNFYGSPNYVCSLTDKGKEFLEHLEQEDSQIPKEAKEIIDNFLIYKTGYLSELSHKIDPWKSAEYGDKLDFEKLPDMNDFVETYAFKN